LSKLCYQETNISNNIVYVFSPKVSNNHFICTVFFNAYTHLLLHLHMHDMFIQFLT